MSRPDARRGLAVGDVLLVISVLAFVFALAYPRIRRNALRAEVAQAIANVQAVADAAERFRGEEQRWPDPAGPGEIPAGLATYLGPGFSFDQGRYRLELLIWETAEEAPPLAAPEPVTGAQEPVTLTDTATVRPPTLYGSLAGVTVASADTVLLAGLLDHFGAGRSFLHAGTWTLVFASVAPR